MTDHHAALSIIPLILNSSSYDDESFEISFSIILRLLESDKFPIIWDHLQAQLDISSKLTGGNQETQTILLKFLDGMQHLTSFEVPRHRFKSTTITLIKILTSLQLKLENIEMESATFSEVMESFTLTSSFLQIITEIGTRPEKIIWNSEFKLLKGLVRALKLINLKFQPKVVNSLKDHVRDLETHPLFQIKCVIIRLISDICYECNEAQNELREEGGLPLILSCCTIDDLNPCMNQKLFNFRCEGICIFCYTQYY